MKLVQLVLALLVVATFAGALTWFGLPTRAREAKRRALQCLEVLQDPAMNDQAKEEALRHQAGKLFGLVGILVGGSLLALCLPLAGVWALGLVGVGSLESVLSVLERPDFLLVVTVVGIFGYWVARNADWS